MSNYVYIGDDSFWQGGRFGDGKPVRDGAVRVTNAEKAYFNTQEGEMADRLFTVTIFDLECVPNKKPRRGAVWQISADSFLTDWAVRDSNPRLSA